MLGWKGMPASVKGGVSQFHRRPAARRRLGGGMRPPTQSVQYELGGVQYRGAL